MNRHRWSALVGAAVLGAVLGLVLFRWVTASHEFSGAVYPFPDEAYDFTLTGDDGQPGSMSDYRGKAVFLYFGYTFCPDVCPTVLARLSNAIETLDPADRDRVQVMMVSLDSARDTPDVLKEYLDHYDPSFVGFTGSSEEIASVAAEYKIVYEIHEGTPATGYLIDHWAGVYLIDPEGLIVESFNYGTTGEEMAADVLEWL